MKKIKLLFLALLVSSIAFAQKSFVFLELNPDIPVNIYLNGEKQKIKNNAFIILPNAKSGLNKLEIETQNKNISKHTFEVLGSEQGNAYKLKKVGSSFKLEDKLSGELFSDNNKIENKIVVAKNIDNKPFEKEIVKKAKKPDYIIEEYKSEPIVKTTTEKVYVEKKDKGNKNVEKTKVTPTTPPIAQQGRTYAMYERRKLEQESLNRRMGVEKNYRKINKEKKELIKKENATKSNIETTYPDNQKEVKKEIIKVKEEQSRAPQAYDDSEKELKKAKTKAKRERAEAAQDAIEEKVERKKEATPKKINRKTAQEEHEEEIANEANRLKMETAERAKREHIEARRKEEEAKEIALLEAKKNRKREQLEARAARYERKELNKSDIDLHVNESKKQISSIKTEIIEVEPNDDNTTNNFTTLEASSYISDRCRRIVGEQEFEQILETFKNKVDDEAKVNYFKRKITSECYMTDQIVTLSKEIETQTGRYKFIEAMKENIADIENVRKFRELFTYKSYRKKINSLFE
ncbi:MAG: DUF4476 domain-containing protein [Chitinophagaceae bacterium]|nr:DUF4476 domain-containing protein [Chitinophagaceae bacterium]